MERRTVQLKVAGQSYRVVSSSSDEELRRLAGRVEAKLLEVVPAGRPLPAGAILLAALALAHEADEERGKRESLERKARDVLRRTLVRVDAALDRVDDEVGE